MVEKEDGAGDEDGGVELAGEGVEGHLTGEGVELGDMHGVLFAVPADGVCEYALYHSRCLLLKLFTMLRACR